MSQQSFSYHVCGLKISSEFDLGLNQTQFSEPDVTFSQVDKLPKLTKKKALGINSPIADILIVEAKNVLLVIKPNVSLDDIRLEIIHTVINELLILRNVACLHGCVLTKNGITVAFIAPSGKGKSTLAAILVEKNWALVSDDLLLLKIINNKIVAIPSFPTIRLWEESLNTLGLSYKSKKPIANRQGKYSVDAKGAYVEASAQYELTHLYQFDRSCHINELKLNNIDKKEQFWALLENTFDSEAQNIQADAHRFNLFSQLLSQVTCRKVLFPDNYQLLTASANGLIEDMDLQIP